MVIVPADRKQGTADGFSPRERAIFAYRLDPGRPDWHGDPLRIEARYEELMAVQDPSVVGSYMRNQNVSVRLMGLRRLLPVVRGGFGLPAFDEANPEGLTTSDALRLLDRFHRYLDQVTAKYRREAELVVTYGAMPNRVHTYEREVGLWLNRGRAQAFAGLAHWRGSLAASGAAQAHFCLVDAMASNLEEAAILADQLENDRTEAAARAQSPARGR